MEVEVPKKQVTINRQVTSFNEFGEKRSNLMGMDVMKISHENTKIAENEVSVKEIRKQYFFLRVKLPTNRDSTHIPSLVKKFMKVLREVDTSFQVLPFADNVSEALNDDKDIVTHEDHFPDDVPKLEKWVQGIEVDRAYKLNFSLRVTNSMQFRDLRDTTKNWCDKNDCTFTYDTIETAQIFRAGWIRGVHPRYHDRNAIKEALSRQYPILRNKITIYPRTLWVSPGRGQKVLETDGLAIDGDFNYQKEILKALYSIRWTCTKYPKSLFVPFKATRGCTRVHQTKFIKAHTGYLNQTYTKVIELKENVNLGSRSNPLWFTEWMENFKMRQESCIDKAELFDGTCVRLIYNKSKEHVVQEVIAHAFSNIELLFGKKMANKLLGDEKAFNERKELLAVESEYSKSCDDLTENIVIPEKREEQRTRDRKKNLVTKPKGPMNYAAAAGGTKPAQKKKQINNDEDRYIKLEQIVQNNMQREEAFRREMDRRFDERMKESESQVQQHISENKNEVDTIMKKQRVELGQMIKASEEKMDKKLEQKEGKMVQTLADMQHLLIATQKSHAESTAQMILRSQTHILESMHSLSHKAPRDVELRSIRGVGR